MESDDGGLNDRVDWKVQRLESEVVRLQNEKGQLENDRILYANQIDSLTKRVDELRTSLAESHNSSQLGRPPSGSDAQQHVKLTLDLAAIGRSIDEFKGSGVSNSTEPPVEDVTISATMPTVTQIDAAQRQQLKYKISTLEQVGSAM